MIVKLGGGQGNQMFQYAMGRAVSLKRGEPLILDISFFNKNERNFELDKYQIFYDKLITKNRRTLDTFLRIRGFCGCCRCMDSSFGVYCEKECFVYENIESQLIKNKKYCFWGYWQNIQYFDKIRDVLLRDFVYKMDLTSAQKNIIEMMKKENSVAIHVRRTDYLIPGSYEHFTHPTRKYYDKALAYIVNRIGNVNLYIFSDDIEWCKQEFSDYERTIFIDKCISQNQQTDIELMRNCRHFIIANSTFSWWGGWLSEYDKKIIISPYDWFADKKHSEKARRAILGNIITIKE